MEYSASMIVHALRMFLRSPESKLCVSRPSFLAVVPAESSASGETIVIYCPRLSSSQGVVGAKISCASLDTTVGRMDWVGLYSCSMPRS